MLTKNKYRKKILFKLRSTVIEILSLKKNQNGSLTKLKHVLI